MEEIQELYKEYLQLKHDIDPVAHIKTLGKKVEIKNVFYKDMLRKQELVNILKDHVDDLALEPNELEDLLMDIRIYG